MNRDPKDFYPTQRVGTLGLLAMEKFKGLIWEPAAGDGAISEVLIERGHTVISTDLYDHGYTKEPVDFLAQTKRVANIITNPPFKLAEEFVIHALGLARRKVAMLFRLAYLEGQGRYASIYTRTPPARVLVFSRRLGFARSGVGDPGGMMPFAWLVWDKDHIGETILRWIPPNAGEK
jgi:hypothetical protein